MAFPDETKEYDAFPEYRGMSYEAASREAERLIEQDGWFRSFHQLRGLYALMCAEAKRANSPMTEDEGRAMQERFDALWAERIAVNDAVRAAPPLDDIYGNEVA